MAGNYYVRGRENRLNELKLIPDGVRDSHTPPAASEGVFDARGIVSRLYHALFFLPCLPTPPHSHIIPETAMAYIRTLL